MATSIKLPPDLKERLDRVASAQRRSAHWIMLEAIRLYVEGQEARAASGAGQTWASFQDRAQDEIAPSKGKKAKDEDDLPPLRHWSEVLTFAPNPNPDPEREKAWERFKALKGAGASTSGFTSKDEIDAYIRWIRDDR
jgi:predicted transcriptional regulator